ncbi:MAG: hypothetical protein A2Y07_08210 [Planctomycetes bacterium GWF2_50_10]|nr:MAG: hypothetical protein A2Y07_08210 [Planctomycetes bacterium GWF2_50_10]
MNARRQKRGFTLIEALISIVLLGVAIAALMVSNGAMTSANGAGIEMSTAEFLVEQIRELTAGLPTVDPQTGKATFGAETGENLATYDDVDDFKAKTYCPPIDAARAQLTAYIAYTQQITIDKVLATDLTAIDATGASDFFRVTVKVFLNGKELSRASWVRVKL